MSIIYSLASPAATLDAVVGGTSSDGRYVLYYSAGSLALFDQQTGTTRTITNQYPYTESTLFSVSRDGRFVTYIDYDGSSIWHVHLWDRDSGTIRTVFSHSHSIFEAHVSDDHNYIYVTHLDQTADNFVLERLNIQSGAAEALYTGSEAIQYKIDRYALVGSYVDGGVSRLDTQTGAMVQIAPVGEEVLGRELSRDGRFVALEIDFQIYRMDLTTGQRSLISKNGSGAAGHGPSFTAKISADGSHIAFTTEASDISAGASHSNRHVVVVDVTTGAMALVAEIGADGQSTGISDDGSVVTFDTGAQLVTADPDTLRDVYTAHVAPPKITIDTVSGDNLINSTEALFQVKITGTSDAIGKTVLITSPNGVTKSAAVQADGTWSAFVDAANVAEGIRNFTADVVDASNLHGIATKPIDFDYTPPDLRLFAVAGDNIVARREKAAITFDGYSDAIGQQVSLSIDHHSIGHALVGSDGQWNFVYDGTNLTDGQHEIEFSVDDDAGNVTDRSIFFDKVTPHNEAPTFFANGGYVITPVGLFGATGTSLAIGADGKIVVGGWSAHGFLGTDLLDFTAVRYDATGHLDTTFGNGGIVLAAHGTENSIAVQADGKTIIGGGIAQSFGLQRLNVDGTLDTSFGTGGTVTTSFNRPYSGALSVVVDGTRILAAGTADNDFALARYLADGSLDPTFGNGGTVTTDFGSPSGLGEWATSVRVQTDGKIVVGGEAETADFAAVFSLARYNSNGTLDSSFGTGGKVTTAIDSFGDYLSEIQLQSDGKILAVGSTYDGSQSKLALVRYTSSGALDTSFSGDGKVVTDLIGTYTQQGKSVVVQPDGKIVVGGYTIISNQDANAYQEFAVVRYNANGTLDTTFGDAGVVLTQVRDHSQGMSVRLQADGKIVVAGTSFDQEDNSQDFAVARYNPDGSLDREFAGTNTLGNEVSFTEGGAAVVLDATAKIFDSDLAALSLGLGNYGDASVTLARSGGTNAEDLFGASGNLALAGSSIQLAGVTVGSFTQSGGQLVITFGDGATQAQINGVLDAITYANSSHGFAPGTTIQIAWSFSDGNTGLQGTGGAATTAGVTTVDLIPDTTLHLALAVDSGTAGDGITNVGTVNVTGLTPGATWSFSTDGGAHFTAGTGASFALTGDGPKNVLVKEIAPGNVVSTANLSFTLDTSAAGPAVALATDTGTPGDGITKVGTVNVSGLEAGASWQYAVNGGAFVAGTGSSFTLTGDGPKAVLVHQTDIAGNTSGNASLSFTLATGSPPVANNDSFGVNEDATLSTTAVSGVLANDTDADHDPLTVTLVAGPTHGSLTLNGNGSFNYTPDANYFGSDSFTYKAHDADSDSGTATVSITVNAVNDDATITGVSTGSVTEKATPGTAGGTLTAIDIDPGENAFRTPGSLAATYGSFTFNATTGVWGYALDNTRVATQALGASSTVHDTLTVTSIDGTAMRIIDVTVHGANDTAVIGEPTVASVTEDTNVATGELIASGTIPISDPDQGEAAFRTTVTGAAGNLGILTLNAGGSYTYKVANSAVQYLGAGDSKIDTFTVTAFDGTTRSVAFTVNGQNDAAVIGVPTRAGVASNLSFGNTVAAGTISIGDVDQGQSAFRTTVTGATGNLGSLVLAADGSYTYTVANVDILPFGVGETKVDTFTVTALDGTTKAVDFTITGLNNVPVVNDAADLGKAVAGTPVTISETQLLSNVTDADRHDVLHVANLTVAPTSGNLIYNNNGTWTFTPSTAAANTFVTFNYGVTDGHVTTPVADTATLSVSAASDIVGQPGQLLVNGTNGPDHIVIGPTNLVVFAGGGDDTIKLSPTGGFSFHFLDGGSGNDTLDLSALAGPVNVALDTGLGSGAAPPGMLLFSSIENVIGSNAADHIAASSAVNILTGGGGADTFVFNDLNAVRNGTTFDAAKRDTITDFVHGTDRINLSHIDANTGTGGTQHFSGISFWNGTGAEFTAANQLKFHYETINGQEHTIIDGNINGNTGTDFQIDLVRHIALTSSDFILT